MDSLRIVLILVGVAILAGIYLWGRKRYSRRLEQENDLSTEEDLFEEGVIDPRSSNENPFDEEWKGEAIAARRENVLQDGALDGLQGIIAGDNENIEEGEGNEVADEAVIILSLMANGEERFNGMQLLDAMELCGLSHGEMGIFHYPELDSGKNLFSVANVVEPGSFDMESIGELETPGLALFMQLPAAIDGEKALLIFVQQAKRLKEQLGGHLTDSQRRELTRETLDELKTIARRFNKS